MCCCLVVQCLCIVCASFVCDVTCVVIDGVLLCAIVLMVLVVWVYIYMLQYVWCVGKCGTHHCCVCFVWMSCVVWLDYVCDVCV